MPKRDSTLVSFGRNVARIRTERGLSQDKLAEKADVDRTYLSGIERGVRNPGIKAVLKLSRALRDLRTYGKWTQAQLAQKTGLDPTYLSGLERGTRNPSLFILARLAAGLRVPLSVLKLSVKLHSAERELPLDDPSPKKK